MEADGCAAPWEAGPVARLSSGASSLRGGGPFFYLRRARLADTVARGAAPLHANAYLQEGRFRRLKGGHNCRAFLAAPR